MFDDNKRRRDKNRTKNGGMERRGRPSSDGATAQFDKQLTDDDWEFNQAIQAYKTKTNRRFLTNSELLGILKKLGYIKGERHEEL